MDRLGDFLRFCYYECTYIIYFSVGGGGTVGVILSFDDIVVGVEVVEGGVGVEI